MTDRLVQRHAARFSARNHPVDALLGLVHASRWLDGFVARHAAEAEPRPESAGDPLDARAREELTLFLLGLVASGRAVRRVIDEWSEGAPAPEAASAGEDPLEPVGWLR